MEIQTFLFKKLQLNKSSTKWLPFCLCLNVLTHWGWVTHIWVSKLTIIGSDNSLSPGRRQAIIWTNAKILIQTLWTNLSKILSEIHAFSFKKMRLTMSAKWPKFRLGLSVLMRLSIFINNFDLVWCCIYSSDKGTIYFRLCTLEKYIPYLALLGPKWPYCD